jgi:hypothetical protein
MLPSRVLWYFLSFVGSFFALRGKEEPTKVGLSLADDFQFLVYRFFALRAKKRYTITITYHAAAG